MKRRGLLLIPLLAIFIAVMSFILVDQHKTPTWQARLDQYLGYLRQIGGSSPRVISATPALSPINFTPGMSSETNSADVVFLTTHGQGGNYFADLQPLPYPPEQVMCVLLDVSGQNELVYVALHNNSSNNDWIVHISPEPWGSYALQTHLSSLGCSLDT